jgi:TRAP-type C4-dicarboxylate transport system permease small subunit
VVLFFGAFLLLGFHNLIGFGREFFAAHAAKIWWAGWLLVAFGLLLNIRRIIGLVRWGRDALRAARSKVESAAGDVPRPPVEPDVPAKPEPRPIVERRR